MIQVKKSTFSKTLKNHIKASFYGKS